MSIEAGQIIEEELAACIRRNTNGRDRAMAASNAGISEGSMSRIVFRSYAPTQKTLKGVEEIAQQAVKNIEKKLAEMRKDAEILYRHISTSEELIKH